MKQMSRQKSKGEKIERKRETVHDLLFRYFQNLRKFLYVYSPFQFTASKEQDQFKNLVDQEQACYYKPVATDCTFFQQ